MSGAAAGAELAKLGHQLGVPAHRLDFLREVPIAELGELRRQISEALFQADRHHFVRLAALTRTVPVAVCAKITELALPPLLAARSAELLEPDRAAEIVGRLSTGYLARVAAELDPGRSPEVVARIPADKVAAVGAELAHRQEWVVIGGFVSYVSEQGLRAAVARFDGEQLLRIGFVLEDTSRLELLGAALSASQLDEMLQAAGAHLLWRELDQLVSGLADEQADRLAERFATAQPSVRALIVRAHERAELGDTSYARLSGS